MNRVDLESLGHAALPVAAIVSFSIGMVAAVVSAGHTLGFDFLAYHAAAVRILEGRPLYDMSYQQSGGFGLFYYPPTFAPLLVPFGLLGASVATWVWIAASVAMFLGAVAALPVPKTVRWWILLLGGWSFPLIYALKLGQVGPLLFLLFSLGWRWIDRPVGLGLAGAVGAAVKVQPGLILLWALLTRRYRAAGIGIAALLLMSMAASLVVGLGAWVDFATLIRSVTDPITTPHNFTPGAVAYQLGVPALGGALVQLGSTVATLLVVLAACRFATDEASYLVAVIASQLLSPILWDHYAMLLLLPVAYLLAAGRWWAIAIPVVTSWPLVGIFPPISIPLAFWISLVVTFLVGLAARDQRTNLGEAVAA